MVKARSLDRVTLARVDELVSILRYDQVVSGSPRISQGTAIFLTGQTDPGDVIDLMPGKDMG